MVEKSVDEKVERGLDELFAVIESVPGDEPVVVEGLLKGADAPVCDEPPAHQDDIVDADAPENTDPGVPEPEDAGVSPNELKASFGSVAVTPERKFEPVELVKSVEVELVEPVKSVEVELIGPVKSVELEAQPEPTSAVQSVCGRWELTMSMDADSSGTVKVRRIVGEKDDLCLVLPFRPSEGKRGQVSLSLFGSGVCVTGSEIQLETGSVRWVVEKKRGIAEIRRFMDGVEKGSLTLPFRPESGGESPIEVNLPDMRVGISGGKIDLTDV